MRMRHQYRVDSQSGGRPANHRQSGFTLIEVMIASAILGIGMLTISYAFLQSVQTNKLSKSYTSMVMMVNDWMERLQGVERIQAEAVFGGWPGCGAAGQNFRAFINTDTSVPGSGVGPGQALLLPPRLDSGNFAVAGQGVIVSYNVSAYCPENRRSGAASNKIPNGYRVEGTAFLVSDVTAGVGNYEVLSSHSVSFMFFDRPPNF